MAFKCHNCDSGRSLGAFLKDQEPSLHLQYQMESFKEKNNHQWQVDTITPQYTTTPAEFTYKQWPPSIVLLPIAHYAKQYVIGRGIPVEHWNELIYVEDMSAFVKKYIDPDLQAPKTAHLVIVYRNRDGVIVGINARNFAPTDYQTKYFKTKIRKDEVMVYGAESVDTTQKVYVFEGEFDSMFLDNACAVGGINAMSGIEEYFGVNKSNVVCIIDKDQRNREVIQATEHLIKDGYAVCLFPGKIEGKDVNDFVLNHKLTHDQLKELIDKHTYSGLKAKLELSNWRKIR
jgi:hypothetical protein